MRTLQLCHEKNSLATLSPATPGNFVLHSAMEDLQELGPKVVCFVVKNKKRKTSKDILEQYPRTSPTYRELTLFLPAVAETVKYRVYSAKGATKRLVKQMKVGRPYLLGSVKITWPLQSRLSVDLVWRRLRVAAGKIIFDRELVA